MYVQLYESKNEISRLVSNSLFPKFKINELFQNAKFTYACCKKKCDLSIDEIKSKGFTVECPTCFSHYEDKHGNKHTWTNKLAESGRYLYRRDGWSEYYETVDNLISKTKRMNLDIDSTTLFHLKNISNILNVISTMDSNSSGNDIYLNESIPDCYSSGSISIDGCMFDYLDSIGASEDFNRIMLVKQTYLTFVYGQAIREIYSKIHGAGMSLMC